MRLGPSFVLALGAAALLAAVACGASPPGGEGTSDASPDVTNDAGVGDGENPECVTTVDDNGVIAIDCPGEPTRYPNDADRDGVRDEIDNCPDIYNPSQGDGPDDVESDCRCDGVLSFDDPALEARVRAKESVPDQGDLEIADVLGVESLIAGTSGIQELGGIECLRNLQNLNLDGNNIIDVAPLATLTKLRGLTLRSNRISDIAPLSDLVELTLLALNDNNVPHTRPLAGMVRLEHLELERNRVAELEGLRDMGALETLYVSGVMADLGPIANLTSLYQLRLTTESASLSDLTPLASLTSLTNLTLLGGAIRDVSPLGGLTGLTRLVVGQTGLVDIGPLRDLGNLISLDLPENAIVDITPLAGLDNLERVYLYQNQIVDLAPLGGLARLRDLHLDGNGITDISPLVDNQGLGQGDAARLRSNPLADCSQVSALSSRGVTVQSDCP